MMEPMCISMSPEMFERIVWIGVVVLLLVVERWLGITSKTRAASILESVENAVIKKALDEPKPQEEKKNGT